MSEPKAATAEELLVALSPSLGEDILLALRYFYYVKAHSLVPDTIYDLAEKEFREREDTDIFSTPLNLPGSDNKEDYPHHVMALSLYLGMVMEKQKERLLESGKKGKTKKKA